MNIPFSINLIIVILTAITSFIAFQNRTIFHKLKFNASYIQKGEWWRFFSGALVHGDIAHLAFNMIALYSFGDQIEAKFQEIFNDPLTGSLIYLAFYIVAIPISSIYSFIKNRNNSWYNAVGASGAISAVVFSCVIFFPEGTLYLFFAIKIKAWIFGILYLILTWYMARKGNDNIGHDAHFFGAIFGIVVTLIIQPSAGTDFINYITTW